MVASFFSSKAESWAGPRYRTVYFLLKDDSLWAALAPVFDDFTIQ